MSPHNHAAQDSEATWKILSGNGQCQAMKLLRHAKDRIDKLRLLLIQSGVVGEELDMKFKVVLESSDEGGYTARVPSLPGSPH